MVPFQGPVPKVKTVFSLESQPHLEGSRVPENHQFSMFFQGLLQVPSQKALWGGLLKIFENFGLPFGTIFLKKWDLKLNQKKVDF